MRNPLLNVGALVLFTAGAWVACSPGGGSQQVAIPNSGPDRATRSKPGRHLRPSATNPIQHVVIIIQENRSFNNIFGGPSPFPRATTASVGYEHNGNQVTLTKISLADPNPDIDHRYESAITAVNEQASAYQMNGFDLEKLETPSQPNAGSFPYRYVDYNETKPYWFMASHWALGDHFYPTEFGPSFTAHLNLIAGTDEIAQGQAAVDFPSTWGENPTDCNSRSGATVPILLANGKINKYGPYPCFWQFTTMADLLEAHQLSWHYYAPTVGDTYGGKLWSEFDAIERVRCGTTGPISSPCMRAGPDWKNVVTPARQILTDVGNGVLENVTWVVPTFKNSDHQKSKSTTGPAWVASIVNAIGESSFWKSTVIVVLWDDWGGWYDEVPPPMSDFRGRAIRTPVIVISPYAKTGSYYYNQGWVSHYQYEPGSILRFIEVAFNLSALNSLQFCSYCGPLGYTDSTAQHDIGENTLDFTQSPRPFTPVPTPSAFDMKYFKHQAELATAAPDDE